MKNCVLQGNTANAARILVFYFFLFTAVAHTTKKILFLSWIPAKLLIFNFEFLIFNSPVRAFGFFI